MRLVCQDCAALKMRFHDLFMCCAGRQLLYSGSCFWSNGDMHVGLVTRLLEELVAEPPCIENVSRVQIQTARSGSERSTRVPQSRVASQDLSRAVPWGGSTLERTPVLW